MDERTRVLMTGRDPSLFDGAVNPPVHRASTILLKKVSDLYGAEVQTYGLDGMAVHRTLEKALMEIEGGVAALLLPSGLAACTLPFLALCKAGDHALVTDSVYGPTRRFCDRLLKNLGVETTYFDPRISADGLDALIKPNTKLLFLESPGSLTFEFHDCRALTAVAQRRGVKTALDNTWSAGVFFKPFEHGVDLSIQALTKYQGGHADLLLGAILSAETTIAGLLRQTSKDIGFGTSGDDVYQALRGLRTMHLRLAQHDSSAREIAAWMEARPEVAQVLHPALPSFADHHLWKRDFTGAAGLFGVVLKPCAQDKLAAMLEGYKHFGLGFSWGGYESLVIPCDPQIKRTAQRWSAEGPLLRYSIGLETPADLIADLEAGFVRLGQ
ncbi:MAG: cystathionine beta-lyase [Caulobacterales bacterium]